MEEAGFVAISKGFEAKRPLTLCKLTEKGRRRFLDYLDLLERIVRDAHDVGQEADSSATMTRLRPAPT